MSIKKYLKAFIQGINEYLDMWYDFFWNRKSKRWIYYTDYNIRFKQRQIEQRQAEIDKLINEVLDLFLAEKDYLQMHGSDEENANQY